MLDPGRCAGDFLQKRPAVRRRHRHMRPHDAQGGIEFGPCDHRMSLSTFPRWYVYGKTPFASSRFLTPKAADTPRGDLRDYNQDYAQ